MKTHISCIVTGLCVALFLCQTSLFGQTSADFGGAEIVAETTKVQSFIFTTVMRAIAVVGGAWGLIQSFLSSSPKPLFLFGGIGLGAGLVPKFINGVFGVSGMMLP